MAAPTILHDTCGGVLTGVGVGVGAIVGVGVGVGSGVGYCTGYNQALMTSKAVPISRPMSGFGGYSHRFTQSRAYDISGALGIRPYSPWKLQVTAKGEPSPSMVMV